MKKLIDIAKEILNEITVANPTKEYYKGMDIWTQYSRKERSQKWKVEKYSKVKDGDVFDNWLTLISPKSGTIKIWNEEDTDDWYDENNNLIRVSKKIIRNV